MLLMGQMYFVQGLADPGTGLAGQPTRFVLKAAGYDVAQIAAFGSILALPWSMKPLFGLIADRIPLWGSRHRSYLVLSAALASAGLAGAALLPYETTPWPILLAVLLVPSLAIAFGDVVIDAVMVENGQRLGLTGTLQSVQWSASSFAKVLAAYVGGLLSQPHLAPAAFMICAVATALAFFAARKTPESPVIATAPVRLGVWMAIRMLLAPRIVAMGLFSFLWNFTPVGAPVLYIHLTEHLQISEQMFGTIDAANAIASMLAALLYAFYCRRIAFKRLIHAAIALGVFANLTLLGMVSTPTALGVAAALGLAQMTGTMVLMDLAARVCPPHLAATTFALLMALSNLGTSAGNAIGGHLYGSLATWMPNANAFQLLALLGAAASAFCWAVLPAILRDRPQTS